MPARIEYKASVAKDLRRLDRKASLQVLKRIEKTLGGQGPRGIALAGDFEGLFRLRVGDYRVIYTPTRVGYLVLRIAHRKESYRKGRPEP